MSRSPIDWQNIRYRGDAADVQELFETYGIDHDLETAEASEQTSGRSARRSLMNSGILLTEQVSPRIRI